LEDVSLMIGDVKFNYRVGILFVSGNEVLVEVNPDFDFVVPPGGRIKTLENSLDALKREIQEEMKYDLNINDVHLKMLIESFFEFDNKKYHELYFLYTIEVEKNFLENNKGMKNFDSLNNYYEWLGKDDLSKRNLLPNCIVKSIDEDFKHIINDEL